MKIKVIDVESTLSQREIKQKGNLTYSNPLQGQKVDIMDS
jgi:hypothetical protein